MVAVSVLVEDVVVEAVDEPAVVVVEAVDEPAVVVVEAVDEPAVVVVEVPRRQCVC